MDIWDNAEDIPYISKRFAMKKFLDVEDKEIGMSERHNWNDTKAALLDGLPESKRSMVNTLLENQKTSFLAEYDNDELENLINPPKLNDFSKVILPIIRRVVPSTLAQELIGVQPMTGDIGSIYSLRYSYDQRSELEQMIDDAQTVEEYLDSAWAKNPYEDELVAALAQEISDEIDQEIVNELMLMPYKGESKFDEGYFYCPYVPRFLTPADIQHRAFDLAKEVL